MHLFQRVAVFGLSTIFVITPTLQVLALTPNDLFFDKEWYVTRVATEAAWDVTRGDPSIIVAVLDTGVDTLQPDLTANLWQNTKEIPGNHIDDDKNGFIDDVAGWDFVDDDADPNPGVVQSDPIINLDRSHGTFTAGIIGAVMNNAVGYAGIASGVKIMPLRILHEDGMGSEDTAVRALDYAVKNGARVINLSFEGDSVGPVFQNAIHNAYAAGVVVVAALGNDARDVDVTPVYPACLRAIGEDWVIGVSATDEQDAQTYFTNYGATCADLAAPGTDIFGLMFDGGTGISFDSKNQLSWSGTSAASPMVAAAAALVLSAHPDLSPDNVRNILKLSVDPVHSFSGAGALGVGRLNIARALSISASFSHVTSVTPAPSTSVVTGGTMTENTHYSFTALGANPGVAPYVSLHRADGQVYSRFLAYSAGFLGGINVTLADVDFDGTPEVITGAGPGGGPHVRVFSPVGALLHEFFAYDSSSRKGVQVAVGDVTGDGEYDLVTAVGAGVSNDVVVWSQAGVEEERFAVTDFAPGTPFAVGVGDMDADGYADIVVTALAGEPRVAVFDHAGKKLLDFSAYPSTVTSGLSVALGDFDGDGKAEIVVAPKNGAEHVRVFNRIGALYSEFYANSALTAGTNLAVSDLDVDGKNDIVLVPHSGAGDIGVFSPRGTFITNVGSGLVPATGASIGAW